MTFFFRNTIFPNSSIKQKKEFIVTYPTDYYGALTHESIISFFNTGIWEYCISKEKGHQKGLIHDHFHVYLKYIGKNKSGFSAKGKDAERIWDIELAINTPELLLAFGSENWPKDKNNNKLLIAHPNIKFKGDKTDVNCKNSYYMLNYVTKQRCQLNEEDWEIYSNFNWQETLKTLEKKYKKSETQAEIKQLEWKFCIWIKDQILTRPKATKAEIIKDVMNNEDFTCIFFSKHINYSHVLDYYYKGKQNEKPTPYYGIFYVTPALKNYLDYLNDFVKRWYEGTVKRGERPKCLYLSGSGNCGKTSLLSCFGTFSYWCTCWNINNWEGEASYNFFDDYDGSEDYKGNQLSSNWTLLKPWIGGQDLVTISGKFKQPTTVANNKPCIFISNKHFEDRFPEDARKYFKDCGATIVNLPENKNLYTNYENEYKSTGLIFSENWIEYDTRKTWYYLNKVAPKLENKENEPPASPANKEYEENEVILLPDLPKEINENNDINQDLLNEVENEIGRPLVETTKNKRKRKYSVASTSTNTKKTRKESNENN